MKVRRVIEIEGPAEWVKDTLDLCVVSPYRPLVVKWKNRERSVREVERVIVEP